MAQNPRDPYSRASSTHSLSTASDAQEQGWDRQYPARIGTYMYKPGIDGFSKCVHHLQDEQVPNLVCCFA
ncbi:hypothetical protein P5673_024237 [Acropora cervicornis]|uniref:Uncharacterized protein n=1 Tax=Acropora cervicornis TaxID=6130 RepID=A0AAD9UY40_ACRCE|nr:hypothetical protein P5673_024237 [Acropora cervicornis]